MKRKILVTGGDGRFAKILKKQNKKLNLFFASKKDCDILNISSIKKIIKKVRPNILLHCAGLSRPMNLHETNIQKSIDLNIVGTANLVKICNNKNLKLIFFSTSYVYPGTKGNYKENDALLPWNNYGWSKLGAESAVQMYKNSLIIRACMTEKPFVHKHAFSNVNSNFIFHDEFAKKFIKVLNKKGVINIGGETNTIFNFAKKNNKNVKKIKSKGELPLKMDMNLSKYKSLVRK